MAVKSLKAKQTIFAYKTVKGPLHCVPGLVKLLLLLAISFACMYLPIPALLCGIALTALLGFICKLTILEQLTDLKPAIFYCVLMYALSVFSKLFDKNFIIPIDDITKMREFIMVIFTPKEQFLHLALRLTLIIQLSALLFRTTTMLEIRNSLANAVHPAKISNTLSLNIALFAAFIPEIFQIWAQINKAWNARAGKNSFLKIKILTFVLIALCIEKAANKSRAIANRGGWKI